jgi:adenine-specific DNA methylase
VLLVLRKQMGSDTAFLDEIYPDIETEVRRQLNAMMDLDEKHATSPDFADTDHQLAAYAAALRVLTRYAKIEDIDVAYELSKPRVRGAEKSPIERAIDQAVKIAADHLVPKAQSTERLKSSGGHFGCPILKPSHREAACRICGQRIFSDSGTCEKNTVRSTIRSFATS